MKTNEAKQIKVTMNCEIELGSDPVVNSDALNKALKWGFEIIGLDEQRVNLQYAKENIFDSNPEGLAARRGTVALPAGAANPSVKISTRRPTKSPEPEVASDSATTCVLCPGRVRSDNKGCPGCKRKICTNCRMKGSSRAGYCKECAPVLPDARAGNGGAQPNSGPKPGSYTFKKKAAAPAKRTETQKLMCQVCAEKVWTKTCICCTKNVCANCYDSRNDSCKECASR